MPATVEPIRTPRQYYQRMSTAQKQCRGRRFHKFPDLDPATGVLPPGYRVLYHDADGNYFIQETCEVCSRIRFSVARWERGHFHTVSGYRYADPEDDDWIHVPQGVLTPEMIRGFLMDECAAAIKRAARESEAAARAEARRGRQQARRRPAAAAAGQGG
jgi:hypothetical protein